jgi:hypothetical protein
MSPDSFPTNGLCHKREVRRSSAHSLSYFRPGRGPRRHKSNFVSVRISNSYSCPVSVIRTFAFVRAQNSNLPPEHFALNATSSANFMLSTRLRLTYNFGVYFPFLIFTSSLATQHFRMRPYDTEKTASRPICKVNQCTAQSVVWSGTTCEYCGAAFFFFLRLSTTFHFSPRKMCRIS